MKGQTPYPPGFQLALADISGGVCEQCGKSQMVSTHHIWPRSLGKTINRLWNCMKLCEGKCHKSGNYEARIALFALHLRRLMNYCQMWGKRPSSDWRRLESGIMGARDFDELRRELKEEGINGLEIK